MYRHIKISFPSFESKKSICIYIMYIQIYIIDLYCLSKKLILIITFKMIYNQKVVMPQIYHTCIALHNSEKCYSFFLPQPEKNYFRKQLNKSGIFLARATYVLVKVLHIQVNLESFFGANLTFHRRQPSHRRNTVPGYPTVVQCSTGQTSVARINFKCGLTMTEALVCSRTSHTEHLTGHVCTQSYNCISPQE